MTDNGLAALAAALIHSDLMRRYREYALRANPGMMSEESLFVLARDWAAAILGERGVFLPDGRPGEWMTLADGTETIREQAATIATLRAALEIIANATRTEPGEGYAISVSARNIARHALATAKEVGG